MSTPPTFKFLGANTTRGGKAAPWVVLNAESGMPKRVRPLSSNQTPETHSCVHNDDYDHDSTIQPSCLCPLPRPRRTSHPSAPQRTHPSMATLNVLAGRLARRPGRILLLVVVFFFFAYTLKGRTRPPPQPVHRAKTKSFFPPLEQKSANSIELDYCQNFPKALLSEVQVVLKVAAGETSVSKAHLSTVTSCITNLIIVSEAEERLGDREVIDILAELPKSYEVNNLDFQAYINHKKAHSEGETKQESQRSFKLDRFKYLPMVDKAYMTSPKAKWYVFLESDVYFFWDTLFRLLSQLDPTEPHYLGAPHKGSEGRWFAYGGAGIVMSNGLMKQLIPGRTPGSTDIPRENRLATRFENWVKEDARGDAVLAYAIQNVTGTRLEALDPTFTSDELRKITTYRDRWCVPLLSLHQLSPEQMEKLWKWERTRPYNLVCFLPMIQTALYCTVLTTA